MQGWRLSSKFSFVSSLQIYIFSSKKVTNPYFLTSEKVDTHFIYQILPLVGKALGIVVGIGDKLRLLRVSIPKGETKNVLLEIDKRDLSYWDEQTHAFIQVKGPIRFEIGASSADIRQTVMK